MAKKFANCFARIARIDDTNKRYKKNMYQRALFKAIKYFGSHSALAKVIGVKRQTVTYWLNHADSIPYACVLKIVAATQGFVSYHELAPNQEDLNSLIDKFIREQVLKRIYLPVDYIKSNFSVSSNRCKKHHITKTSYPDFLDQPIYVDKNYQLLGCDCLLHLHKELGHELVIVRVVD